MGSSQHARVGNRHTFVIITMHYQEWTWRETFCGIDGAKPAQLTAPFIE
jgi:hypothetical protein